MKQIDLNAFPEFLLNKSWLQIAPNMIGISPAQGCVVTQFEQHTPADAAAGVGTVDVVLTYFRPPNFRGGAIWIFDLFPVEESELIIMEQVISLLGGRFERERLGLLFLPEEFGAFFTLLSLCVVFGLGCHAFLDGYEMAITTDNDDFFRVMLSGESDAVVKTRQLLEELDFPRK